MLNSKIQKRPVGLSEASWSQGVLTLISIILGAAVAIGAERIFNISVSPTGLTLLSLIHALSTFMFITGTYYHVFTAVSFFFVLPNIVWTMLPTAVGIGVIMSAYAIGNTKHFLVAAIVFYGFGTITFFYTVIEHRFKRIGPLGSDTIEARHAERVFNSEMIKNATCFTLMLVISVTIYLMVFQYSMQFPVLPEILFLVGNGLIYTIMVWHTEIRFLPAVRQIWQLDANSETGTG